MQNITPNDPGTRASLALVGLFTPLTLEIASIFVVPAGDLAGRNY